jgi:hypothetical protein
MSACPPHSFRCCAGFCADAFRVVTRNATIEVEPLAPVSGAAAFLFVSSRQVRRLFFAKEPIEN